jgi:bifunctional DNA-binding transcriptional regulator/antitoxin component of YhaV-PrlF toxin-antitoxin module
MKMGVFYLGWEQRDFLEKVLDKDDGKWLFRIGYDLVIMDRIRDIIDCERYDSFDKEVLNEIRDCWLDRVGMRI